MINEDRCRGYRFCMEACPYKKIYFNKERSVSQKCIFCFPCLEQGVVNACARQCPGRIRFVGYLDDEGSAVHKLVKKWKVAVPLHAEYGTEPNVYYVPPTNPARFDEDGHLDAVKPRIPEDYLRFLFGQAGIDAMTTLNGELEKVRGGNKSELLDVLIAYTFPASAGNSTAGVWKINLLVSIPLHQAGLRRMLAPQGHRKAVDEDGDCGD